MFKKLQENAMYWRFRFFTRRWLEIKRRWRERRSPRAVITGVRARGMAGYNPYARSGGIDTRRGVAFVLILAAALTALQIAAGTLTGLSFGVLFLLVVVAITYLFTRFW